MGVGRSKVPTTYASSCFQKNPLPVTCQDFKKNWRRVRERGWEGGGGGSQDALPAFVKRLEVFSSSIRLLLFPPSTPENLSLSLSLKHTRKYTHTLVRFSKSFVPLVLLFFFSFLTFSSAFARVHPPAIAIRINDRASRDSLLLAGRKFAAKVTRFTLSQRDDSRASCPAAAGHET